jgi:hypothetical protein
VNTEGSELAELGVHPADARERVDVHGEQRPEGDDDDLGHGPDAEPDDEQRQQAEKRDRPGQVEQRVEGVLADPAETAPDGEHDRDRDADEEANAPPLG